MRGGHFLLALLHFKVRVSRKTSRYPSTARWLSVILYTLHCDFESLNDWRTARLPLSDVGSPSLSFLFIYFFIASFSSVQWCTVILQDVCWGQTDNRQVTARYHADILELSQPSHSDFLFNPLGIGLSHLICQSLRQPLVLNTEQSQNQDLPGVC